MKAMAKRTAHEADGHPMSTNAKWALGLGIVAALGLAGVGVYYATRKPSAEGGGGGTAKTWHRSSVIHPGDRVRLAIDIPTWTVLANVPFGVPPTPGGLQQVLKGSDFQGQAVSVYAPNSALPSDWPTDDPGNEMFHADFTYGGTQPIDRASYHAPLLLNVMWVLA